MLANIFSFLGDDILVYRDKTNPDWMFSIDITEDGKYLVMYVVKDTSRVRYIFLLINIDYHIILEKFLMGCRLRYEQYWPEYQMDKIG